VLNLSYGLYALIVGLIVSFCCRIYQETNGNDFGKTLILAPIVALIAYTAVTVLMIISPFLVTKYHSLCGGLLVLKVKEILKENPETTKEKRERLSKFIESNAAVKRLILRLYFSLLKDAILNFNAVGIESIEMTRKVIVDMKKDGLLDIDISGNIKKGFGTGVDNINLSVRELIEKRLASMDC
jgi:hypothetical protein